MRAHPRRRLPLLLALLPPSGAAAAQQAGPPAAQPPTDDVVVVGRRDLDPDALVTGRQLNSVKVGDPIRSRQNFDASDRFARCAIKADMKNTALLRAALDSPMNSVRQDNAQRRFVQTHAACATDSDVALSSIGQVLKTGGSGPIETPARELQFYYDRGALFVQAVRAFAPGAKLTTAEMDAPAVQARMIARERPLARHRLPADARFFGAALCMVQAQPGLSLRLVTADLSTLERQAVAAAIANRSKRCFGAAKHVYFDPVQLRFYLADALYRWLVAVRGVDSLVPDRG